MDLLRRTAYLRPLCLAAMTLSACQGQATPTAATLTSPQASPIPPSPTPVLGPLVNGNFETGDLTGWLTLSSGDGRWLVYHEVPSLPKIPAPPQGEFAALTVMISHGSRTLFQDVFLDDRYMLRFIVFYVKDEGSLNDRNYLRVELIDPEAPPTTQDPDDVLATVFQTAQGDPLTLGPTSISFDLSPWQGQHVRIRFKQTDTLGPLHVGLDDIRLESLGD